MRAMRPACLPHPKPKTINCSAPLKLDRLKLEFVADLPWLGEALRTMKASKFTEAQKAFILKQGEEGTPVAEICRRAGIREVASFT